MFGFQNYTFVELSRSYQPAKFHLCRLSGSNFMRAGGKHPPQTYMLSKNPVLRDGPLFFYRGVTIFGTCRQFFERVMCFKQFFLLHFVMKTIFYDHF